MLKKSELTKETYLDYDGEFANLQVYKDKDKLRFVVNYGPGGEFTLLTKKQCKELIDELKAFIKK